MPFLNWSDTFLLDCRTLTCLKNKFTIDGMGGGGEGVSAFNYTVRVGRAVHLLKIILLCIQSCEPDHAPPRDCIGRGVGRVEAMIVWGKYTRMTQTIAPNA